MRHFAALSFLLVSLGLAPLVHAQSGSDSILSAPSISAEDRIARITGSARGSTVDEDVLINFGTETDPDWYVYPWPITWHKWTAPISGSVSVQLSGYGFWIFGITLEESPEHPNYDITGRSSLSTSYNNSGVSLSSYGYTVEGGKTYYVGIERYDDLGTPGPSYNYTLVQMFTPNALSDSFAGREPIGGEKFSFRAVIGSLSAETGEPQHAASALTPARKTGWMTLTREKRTAVTLTASSNTFKPILAAYTGEAVDALTPVAHAVSKSSNRPYTATLTFVAEAGVPYAVVVDGDGGAGAFTLSGSMSTTKPGFLVKPVSTTVTQGESATFTATALYTGDVVTYQWERKAAGTKTWSPIKADDYRFAGAATDTLTVWSSTLDLNQDQYRVVATDEVDSGTSTGATLTVTEFSPIVTEVLGTVGFDSIPTTTIPAPSNGGVYFAKGLPKGLSINPTTGEITGVVAGNAKPGVYRVTYGTTNGKKANSLQYVLLIEVSAFSPELVATFEALVQAPEAYSRPVGKLTVISTSKGTYSGKYFDLRNGKTHSFKGSLALDQDTRTAVPLAEKPIVINRGKSLAPLRIDFSLNEPSLGLEVPASLSAEVRELGESIVFVGDTFTGRPISKFTAAAPALWAGSYTALLPTELNLGGTSDDDMPRGSAYAAAKITGSSGKLALRGRLAEGSAFTASVSSSADARYLVAQKVHSGTGGSLSGEITLNERFGSDLSILSYNCPDYGDSRLFWVKPADKDYTSGVGPISLRFYMEPWSTPANHILTFSLSETGASSVVLDHRDFNNSSANTYGLPANIALNKRGVISVTDLDLNVTAKLKLSLNSSTGIFSGSFTLNDTSLEGRSTKRTVPISGVMLQKADIFQDSVIGAGYFVVPGLAPSKIKTSGLVEIRAGAIDERFGGGLELEPDPIGATLP